MAVREPTAHSSGFFISYCQSFIAFAVPPGGGDHETGYKYPSSTDDPVRDSLLLCLRQPVFPVPR
ncbi:MAG: hypothetical protein ACK5MM_05775, partial [Planctomyces sp.]